MNPNPHTERLKVKILDEFRHYLNSRGFKSGTDFEPWERETKRIWAPHRGTGFVTGFLEKNEAFREYSCEVHQVVDDDIGFCFKITP
jgi:hypothetical protein